MSVSKIAQKRRKNIVNCISLYDKVVCKSLKFLQHVNNSDKSVLQFIEIISKSQSKWNIVFRTLQSRVRSMRKCIKQLKEEQYATREMLESESARRLQAERARDRFKRKLDVIKEVLQGNDVDGARKYLENIDQSFNFDKSVTRFEHSAGSLLDPENVSEEKQPSEWDGRVSKRKRSKSNGGSDEGPVQAHRRSARLREHSSSVSKTTTVSNSKTLYDQTNFNTLVSTHDDYTKDCYFNVLAKPTFTAGTYLSTVPSVVNEETTSSASSDIADVHNLVACQTNTNNSNTPSSTTINRLNRSHNFISRSALRMATCAYCGHRILFGRSALKCITCRLVVHPHCSKQFAQTCIPSSTSRTPISSVQKHVGTPGSSPHLPIGDMKNLINSTKGMPSPNSFMQRTRGFNMDLTELCPEDQFPRIPALVIHCVTEVLARGMHTVGIYRLSGSDKRVRELCEKFLQGKNPVLARIDDIHVVCGCLKMFLRSLSEPLVTYHERPMFEAAASRSQEGDENAVQLAVDSLEALPAPNRDTLSYIMLHLKTVARSSDCQMNEDNLSKVFGPTLIGYSCTEPQPLQTVNETKVQQAILRLLFQVPDDVYSVLLSNTTVEEKENWTLQQSAHFSPLIPVSNNTPATPMPTRRTPAVGSARSKRFLPYFSSHHRTDN